MFSLKREGELFRRKMSGQGRTLLDESGRLVDSPLDLMLANWRICPEDGTAVQRIRKSLSPEASANLALRDEQLEEAIPLPEPLRLRQKLDESLINRKCERQFADHGVVSFRELATLLRYAAGIVDESKQSLEAGGGVVDVTFRRRSYASAGGLYPIHLYIGAHRVDGLQPSVYLYQPVSRTLVSASPWPDSLAWSDVAIKVEHAPLFVFFSYHVWQNCLKYGDMGLMFACMEVGAMMQNLQLVATALKLKSCPWGSAPLSAMEAALGLEYYHQPLLSCLCLGGKE